jgi:hypothetical protein
MGQKNCSQDREPYSKLTEEKITTLKQLMKARLPIDDHGDISFTARVNPEGKSIDACVSVEIIVPAVPRSTAH